MPTRATEDVLACCGLFAGLDATRRGLLASLAQRRDYDAGQTIFLQDEPCPGLFVVDTGLVRVYRVAPSGQEHVLHLCGPGQTFAEVAAIGSFPLPASACAAEASGCVLIPAAGLGRELATNHALCRQLLTGMAVWVRHLVQLLEDIALRDAAGRVARLLCDTPRDDAGLVTLPGAKKDLANHLNLTSETFSRVLRRLGEMGLIELGAGRGVRVVQAGALEELAGR